MSISDMLVTLVLLLVFVPVSLLPLYFDPRQQEPDTPEQTESKQT
jgi:hypothetical protein